MRRTEPIRWTRNGAGWYVAFADILIDREDGWQRQLMKLEVIDRKAFGYDYDAGNRWVVAMEPVKLYAGPEMSWSDRRKSDCTHMAEIWVGGGRSTLWTDYGDDEWGYEVAGRVS